MKQLTTIQSENKLNDVFALDEPASGGARHQYMIVKRGTREIVFDGNGVAKTEMASQTGDVVGNVEFQKGPRNDPDSIPGVLDEDLLEIVRDRLTDFQNGPFACAVNADALNHITAALMALNSRTQDRAERGVLGINAP